MYIFYSCCIIHDFILFFSLCTFFFQLKVSQQLRLEYRFVERNGWPVMSNQETILSLVDILLGQIVCIQNCDRHNFSVAERPNSLITSTTNPAIENQLPSPSDNEPKRKRSIRFFRYSSIL